MVRSHKYVEKDTILCYYVADKAGETGVTPVRARRRETLLCGSLSPFRRRNGGNAIEASALRRWQPCVESKYPFVKIRFPFTASAGVFKAEIYSN